MGEFIVTTGSDVVDADDGELSLREAITLANDDDVADTITFDLDPGDTTLRLTQGTLGITNELTIDGAGEITITGDVDGNDTVVDGVTDLAATDAMNLVDNVRLFELSGSAADTTFSGLTLTGGNSVSGDGGAINSGTSDITVTNSTISGNTARFNGGGIYNSSGNNTVTNSTISGNMVRTNGGAIYTASGTNTVTNSTISGNTAGSDGGGIHSYAGTNAVTNSTISGNTAGSDGGGIFISDGTNTVTNSTISGNTAGLIGGGIHNLGGTNTVTNSTISGNTAGSFGGGIYNVFGTNTVTNSILTGNYSDFAPNVAGFSNLEGGNIVGGIFLIDGVAQTMGLTAADVFAETAEIIVDGEATGVFTGVLADNGGDVQTVALLADADNVALDAVVAPSSLGGVDARGEDRGQRVTALADGADDTPSDLGAFELQTSDIESDLVVTTTADGPLNLFDDELTLREALILANDGDTITFDADVFSDANFLSETSTIYLQQGTLEISGDITIDGDTDGDGDADVVISGDAENDDDRFTAGSNNAFITNAAENGNGDDNVRVLRINSDDSGDVMLNGLVITGGNVDGAGGGINVSGELGGSLTIENTLLAGNTAGGFGGGITAGLDVTIRNSDISHNIAANGGGGLDLLPDDADPINVVIENSNISNNSANTRGGGLNAESNVILTIADSVISDNFASNDGGGIYSTGILTLTSSLIANNTSGENGGGIFTRDSNDETTTVSLNNTTIANNVAGFENNTVGFGGAIYTNGVEITADHVTLTGNEAQVVTDLTTGTAVFTSSGAVQQGESGQTVFTNSLIVGNSAGSDGSQFSLYEATVGDIDGGNNIIGNDDAGLIFAQTDTFTTAAGTVTFGVLADNGGDTETVALLADADNLALDNASGDGPATDARGRSRSDFAGLGLGIADIGAFELLNVAPVLSAASFTIAENETDVGVVAASDDVDAVAFSISGGADAALFEIDASSGALRFSDAQNFEAPADADEDNVYEVVVAASDGNEESTQAFDVAVTDVAEAQTIIATPDGGTVTGSDEGDTVAGNTGDDVVNAGLGDDIIVDPGGDDTVNAGGGDDRVGLISGMNTVSGGDGADLIVGGFGNDALMGDAGMDVIRGDVSTNLFGSDRIAGGTGDDLLEGRGGVDTFVFTTGDGADTIGALDIDYVTPANTTVSGADFVSGVDLIELNGFGFADGTAALAQVTDVDGVATFSDQGTTITFAGLTADDLSADDFILV